MRINSSNTTIINQIVNRQIHQPKKISIENGFGAQKKPGKFDSLVLSKTNAKTQEMMDIQRVKNRELIEALRGADWDKKLEEATTCSWKLQEYYHGFIKSEKYKVEEFTKFSKEKAYYQNLLQQGDGDIIISKGEYGLEDIQGQAVISRAWLEGKLSETQGKIEQILDSGLERHKAEFQDMAYRIFLSHINCFSAATDNPSFLNNVASAEEFYGEDGRTEDNFLEKSRERVETFATRSNQLRKSLEEFIKSGEDWEELSKKNSIKYWVSDMPDDVLKVLQWFQVNNKDEKDV